MSNWLCENDLSFVNALIGVPDLRVIPTLNLEPLLLELCG